MPTIRDKIFIVTNGKVTEKLYFTKFKDVINSTGFGHLDVQVIPLGSKSEPTRILNKAIEIHKSANKGSLKRVWAVIEKDNFADFEKAYEKGIEYSKNNKTFRIVYSNIAIEFWFLLHFFNSSKCHSVKSMINVLNRKLKKPYFKNSDVYDELYEKISTAITHAKIIDQNHKLNNTKPIDACSNTTIYHLVKELYDIIK